MNYVMNKITAGINITQSVLMKNLSLHLAWCPRGHVPVYES